MEIAGCAFPDDRLYSLEHEVWWKPDGPDGVVRLGVVATFGAFAGPFTTFAFRPADRPLGAGRSVATVESLRLTGAIRLPVAARVVDRNSAVERRPRLLNDDPYGDGWVVTVRPEGPTAPGDRLLPLAEAAEPLGALIRERRIRCWPKTPDVELAEIGLECSAVLVKLNEALARREVGGTVLLVTDDPTSPIEMVRWSDQTGYPVLAHRRDGPLQWFLVERIAAPVPRRRGPA